MGVSVANSREAEPSSSDAGRFKPFQPFPLRLANKFVQVLDRFLGRVLTADEQDMIQKAKEATGLNDFGDDLHMEPLRILCEHTRLGNPLTVFGRLAARRELRMRLQNKLQIHSILAEHPEILQQPVTRPIFILGLPRTGTTLLQRLLAVDSDNRALHFWEMNQPVPPPEPDNYHNDPRIAQNKFAMNSLHYVAPDLKMIHEAENNLPEECLSLMANGLVSGFYCSTSDSPYIEWFLSQDHTPTYRFHKQQLQLLQWKFPAQRWVLKSPWHLYCLEHLLQDYPDAQVVQLHRDPVDVLPSLASLLATSRAAMYEDVDPVQIGAEATQRASNILGRGLQARAIEEHKEGSQARFQDIYYRDLVDDPIATVEKIYAGFNLDLSPQAAANMRQYLEDNPQGKHGKHRYGHSQFGLNATAQREKFRAYCERFNVV